MGKDGGRKRQRRLARMHEIGNMEARMPKASLKCLRVFISALERDKDKEAAGGEDGRSKKEREDEGDKGIETECKKEADRAENVVTGS